jgi:hypothetical protein
MHMMWEVILFHKLRELADGITFFELVVNADFFDNTVSEHQHNPKLTFRLVVLNYTIFEVVIYNAAAPIEQEYQAKFKYTLQ